MVSMALVGAFATILIVAPSADLPYGPAKHLVAIGAGLFALSFAFDAGRARRIPAVLPLAAALVTLMVVAALAGPEPLTGLIGTPERRFGALAWAAMAGYAFAGHRMGDRAAPDSTTKGGLRSMAGGAAVVTIVLVAYAIVQRIDGSALRVGSFLGQSAYLGAALCLLVPLSASLVVADRSRVTAEPWRALGLLATVVGVVGVALGGSRATLVGLCVALLAAAFIGRNRDLLVVACLGGVATAIGWFVLASPSIASVVSRATWERRWDEWAVGARALGASALLGYGPDGYRTVFGRYVPVDYVQAYGRSTVTDRAHNALLDVGLAGGMVAMLLYGGVLLLVGTSTVRALRSGEPATVGLAAGMIAYTVQAQALFPLVEVDPLWWIGAGYLGARYGPSFAGRRPWFAPTVLRTAAARGWVFLTAALASVVVAAGVAEVVTADVPWSYRSAYLAAEEARAHLDVERARERNEHGLALAPADPVLVIQQASLAVPEEALAMWRSLAVESDPNNPTVQVQRGTAEALAGNGAAAVVAWRRAAELDLDWSEPLVLIARFELTRGDTIAARRWLAEAVRRNPEDLQARRLTSEIAETDVADG